MIGISSEADPKVTEPVPVLVMVAGLEGRYWPTEKGWAAPAPDEP